MKITSLSKLIEELDQCIDGQFGEPLSRLELSKSTIEEIEAGCDWSETFYTRNLIHRNSNYETLFLCWQPNQISPIHNHSGQDCWVNILQGTCEEKLYVLDEKTNNIKLISSSISEKGTNAYINDDIALHSLQNIGKNKMITLHVYSNPIDSCFAYDINTGQKKLVQTRYNKTFIIPDNQF